MHSCTPHEIIELTWIHKHLHVFHSSSKTIISYIRPLEGATYHFALVIVISQVPKIGRPLVLCQTRPATYFSDKTTYFSGNVTSPATYFSGKTTYFSGNVTSPATYFSGKTTYFSGNVTSPATYFSGKTTYFSGNVTNPYGQWRRQKFSMGRGS